MIFASGIYIYARTDIIKNSLKANKMTFEQASVLFFSNYERKYEKHLFPTSIICLPEISYMHCPNKRYV